MVNQQSKNTKAVKAVADNPTDVINLNTKYELLNYFYLISATTSIGVPCVF